MPDVVVIWESAEGNDRITFKERDGLYRRELRDGEGKWGVYSIIVNQVPRRTKLLLPEQLAAIQKHLQESLSP